MHIESITHLHMKFKMCDMDYHNKTPNKWIIKTSYQSGTYHRFLRLGMLRAYQFKCYVSKVRLHVTIFLHGAHRIKKDKIDKRMFDIDSFFFTKFPGFHFPVPFLSTIIKLFPVLYSWSCSRNIVMRSYKSRRNNCWFTFGVKLVVNY